VETSGRKLQILLDEVVRQRRTVFQLEVMMTSPANTVKDEVNQLMKFQIETFRQPALITSSQLHEYHDRSEKLRMLCQELDRIGTSNVVEQLRRVS
jgi:hypothetical protein